MKQIQLSESQALDYMRAQGAVAAAQFNFAETQQRILDAHEVPQGARFQIVGDVLTVYPEAPHAP